MSDIIESALRARGDAATIAPYTHAGATDYELVVGDPRFRQLELVHAGHLGECPSSTDDGLACWRWSVRFTGPHGMVSFDGQTSGDAIARAATWVVTGRDPSTERPTAPSRERDRG